MGHVYKPTMHFRWVPSYKASDPRNAVKSSYRMGYGWPDNVVLQQLWLDEDENEQWRDIELNGKENMYRNQKE